MYTGLDCFLDANDGKVFSNDLLGHGLILDKSKLISRRLSVKPKGNSIKSAKYDLREFVLFEYSKVTLENIKRGCKVHYRENLTTCDILISDQGPSCSRLDQIPSFKVIYVNSILSEALELDPIGSQPQYKKIRKSCFSYSVVSPVSTAKSIVSSVVPKSLSSVDMLEFGKIIKTIEKKILNVVVEEFDIESTEWVALGLVSFRAEIAHFGEGGFRYAFKASGSSNPHKFRDAAYVIKRYKVSALENIEILYSREKLFELIY